MKSISEYANDINWNELAHNYKLTEIILNVGHIPYSKARIGNQHTLDIECGYQRSLMDWLDNQLEYPDENVSSETTESVYKLFDWFRSNETIHTLVCRYFSTDGSDKIKSMLNDYPEANDSTVCKFDNLINMYIDHMKSTKVIKL